ncbi:MAG: RpoL/Rpb11 RNA polymerase subunit family protein [Candidatus Hodarchaeota archaeon]
MAKKKAVKPEDEDEEDLDDLEDDLLDDDIGEYPEVNDKKEKEVVSSSVDDDDIDVLPEEEFEIEEEARFPDYKHLKLNLTKIVGENDYELVVEGQSHGFCNILVKHLLNIEGVNAAAYKVTGIVPAQIFIRLDPDKKYKIKDILYEAIESLREEVIEVQKLFQKLT